MAVRREGRQGRSYQKAREVREGFHGRGSRGEMEVLSQYRYQKNIADLGWMIDLEILSPEVDEVEVLEFPEEEFKLGCSPDQKQLYIVAANRKKRMDVDVRVFDWIPEEEAKKPKVILGEISAISYFTDKHHLEGPKYQKDGAPYRHEFGTEGANDGNLPMAVYDRLNGVVEIVGGSYEVTELGIKG